MTHVKIEVQTAAPIEVIDVTDQVGAVLSDLDEGIVLLTIPHTTAALIMCEDDAELRQDLVRVAERWLDGVGPFSHIKNDNPNAEAHILSAFGGTQILVPVSGVQMGLGTYQNILFLEFDGPRLRTINVHPISQRER